MASGYAAMQVGLVEAAERAWFGLPNNESDGPAAVAALSPPTADEVRADDEAWGSRAALAGPVAGST